MRPFQIFSCLAIPAALAACGSAETAAIIEDPTAFECRERAVGLMSVDFEQTSARPISTDIFGTQTYEVTAAGQTFRCLADDEGNLFSFNRI